jgi:hypothetical protein
MCCMQARAKHDTVNTVTAGCVTGGSMSARGIYLPPLPHLFCHRLRELLLKAV